MIASNISCVLRLTTLVAGITPGDAEYPDTDGNWVTPCPNPVK